MATAATLLGFAIGGCTDTNIVGPARSDGSAGSIVFASNRKDGNFDLYALTPGGSAAPTRLTNDPSTNDFAPVLSHDGSRIAWEREVASTGGVVAKEIWVSRADGSDAHAVVSDGAYNESPSWTADDASLVYASDASGNWEVYAVAVDGGTPVNLSNDPYADRHPRVSPDGTRIAFQSNRDLDFEIYVMGIDGSDPVNLTRNTQDDRFPTWTPDGAHILWSNYVDSFDVWMMNADGTDQRALVASSYDELAPSVSPDGSLVVFQSDRGPPMSLFVVPLAGGEIRQLTGLTGSAAGSDQDPSWGR
jgi:Tol biopolymer transport system component